MRPPPLRLLEDVEPLVELVRLLLALSLARPVVLFVPLLPLLLLLPPRLPLVVRRELAVPLLLPLLLPVVLVPLLRVLPLLALLPELRDDFVLRPDVWRDR